MGVCNCLTIIGKMGIALMRLVKISICSRLKEKSVKTEVCKSFTNIDDYLNRLHISRLSPPPFYICRKKTIFVIGKNKFV